MHTFSSINSKNFFKLSIEYALVPALCSLFLGLGVLVFESKELGDKLKNAIFEFIQLDGLHLALLIGIVIVGVKCYFNYIDRLQNLLAWAATSIAAIGFNFAAVISGVALGLSIPVAIEQGSFIWFLLSLFLSAYFVAVQWVFAGMSEVANFKSVREREISLTLSGSEREVYFGIFVLAGSLLAVLYFGADFILEL